MDSKREKKFNARNYLCQRRHEQFSMVMVGSGSLASNGDKTKCFELFHCHIEHPEIVEHVKCIAHGL